MILFDYQPGDSLLHRLNPLTLMLLFISLISGLSLWGWGYQLIMTVIVAIAHITAGVRLTLKWQNILFFLILTALIFWGENRQYGWIAGSLKAWRFVLILYSGLIFSTLMDPMDLGENLYRLTRPIPFFPAGKLMILVSLTLSFLPIIQQENLQIHRAVKSRRLHSHPSPLRRIFYIVYPLISGVIRRGDNIAQALYSRCLSKDPTLLTSPLKKGDLLLISTALLIPLSGLFLRIMEIQPF